MGIYLNEEYLNEHGGAHKKWVNNMIADRDKAVVYKTIASETKDDKINEKLHDGAVDNYDKYGRKFKNKYRKYTADVHMHEIDPDKIKKYVNKHRRPNDKDNHTIYNDMDDDRLISWGAKHMVGAGEYNIPKNREPGTYLKAQEMLKGKRKSIKEACEYILSVLDEG